MEAAIEAKGLTKRFGDVVALDGLDLRVPAGGVFGFLGPNGAGKTTTLHILLGLVPADAGSAHVAGFPVRSHAHQVRQHCGALLEHNGLYENLTALENLQFSGRMYGLPKDEATTRSRMALERLGLLGRAGDRVGTWSKGMKQRLAICRALLHGPRVVFLDEPTNGFDPRAAKVLHDDLRRLVHQHGLTVFLTTHNMREAEPVCDEVAVLRRGRIVAQGPPGGLVGGAPRLEVRLERGGAKAAAAARRLACVEEVVRDGDVLTLQLSSARYAPDVIASLVQAGARIQDARQQRPGLEEAFLQLLELEEA